MIQFKPRCRDECVKWVSLSLCGTTATCATILTEIESSYVRNLRQRTVTSRWAFLMRRRDVVGRVCLLYARAKMHIRVGVFLHLHKVVSYLVALCMSTCSIRLEQMSLRDLVVMLISWQVPHIFFRRRQHHLPLAWTEALLFLSSHFVEWVMTLHPFVASHCRYFDSCRPTPVLCQSV